MQPKRLVIDASIRIRGVFGQRVRELIAASSEQVAFYMAEANVDEARSSLHNSLPDVAFPRKSGKPRSTR
jgi:hypothetical protein